LLPLILLGASLALAKETEKSDVVANKAPISSQDSKGGFGRPETITGTIVMVRPEEGIVILAVRGPSEPPSTQIVVHQKTFRHGDTVVREQDTTAAKGPGETDFSFRVISSTLIKVDGEPVALRELATSKDREATVRFVPQRPGNFALGIEVG
jgi:hypothetical protein